MPSNVDRILKVSFFLVLIFITSTAVATAQSRFPSPVQAKDIFKPYRGTDTSLKTLRCGKVKNRWQLILSHNKKNILFSSWQSYYKSRSKSSNRIIRRSALKILTKFPSAKVNPILTQCRSGVPPTDITPTPTPTSTPDPLIRLNRSVSDQDVRHLYQRAALGAVPDEAYTIAREQGLEAVVDYMMRYQSAASVEADATRFIDDLVDESRDEPRVREWGLMYWSFYLLLNSPNRYHERLAFFFLHNLLATSQEVLAWEQKDLMRDHMNLLRAGAVDGNYIPLLKKMSRDPAMLIWLDGATNTKQAPNINYAREMFELFTLGSPNPLFPNEKDYVELDVRRSGRMHAGWGVQRIQVLPGVWVNSRVLRSAYVDTDPQTIFEGTSCETQINFNESTGLPRDMEVIDQTFACRRPEHFLAWRLAKEYLNETPSHDAVVALSKILREENFNFNKTLKKLFLSEVFYSSQNQRSIVMSPVEQVVQGILRAKMTTAQLVPEGSGTSTQLITSIVWWLKDAGFRLTKFPTVFGTKSLDYANSAWQLYFQNTLTNITNQNVLRPINTGEGARTVLWTWSQLLPPGRSSPTSSQILDHLLPQFNLTNLTSEQRIELSRILDKSIGYNGATRQITSVNNSPFNTNDYWHVNARLPRLWVLLVALNNLR
jgi:hypothetical protein